MKLVEPIRELTFDQLVVGIYPDNQTLGRAAAEAAISLIRQAIAERGVANVVLAAANSQLTFLENLAPSSVPWESVNLFHMDEYLNLPWEHPARFSSFLRRHLVDRVPARSFHPVIGDRQDAQAVSRSYADLLLRHPVDLCCLGIGENGHIAFNDPPAVDFHDPEWVKVVTLAETSRRQQVGEGHFASLRDVPTHALTLTVPALLASRNLLCIVPERRKAKAVRETLLGPITPDCPASILRQAPHTRLFLDLDSASEIP
jgi:glucosamine-6-phosphate deaminase